MGIGRGFWEYNYIYKFNVTVIQPGHKKQCACMNPDIPHHKSLVGILSFLLYRLYINPFPTIEQHLLSYKPSLYLLTLFFNSLQNSLR